MNNPVVCILIYVRICKETYTHTHMHIQILYIHIYIYIYIYIQSTLPLVDTVLSGHLSLVDKSSGPGRMSLYFNIILSLLSGPLSYVENGHIFWDFG